MKLSLPPIRPDWHKYERGFLVGFGGSKEYKGAIKLTGRAALNAGAGIVRLFSLEEIGPVADELIFQVWKQADWKEALTRATAVCIGPGLGRKLKVKKWLLEQLHKIEQPVVLDADALFFLPAMKKWPKNAILTPHKGEMTHLLGGKSDSFMERTAEYAEKHQVLIVLKGMPTHIFSPGGSPIAVSEGDPGMATAGSGDVLTGIIGALLAQKMKPKNAAVLGVTLHGLAGKAAAQNKTSYCVTASDLIATLPDAFHQWSR